MEEANSLWCDALLAAARDPDNSEESSSTRNSKVNDERAFLWFGVYGKTRRRDQTVKKGTERGEICTGSERPSGKCRHQQFFCINDRKDSNKLS